MEAHKQIFITTLGRPFIKETLPDIKQNESFSIPSESYIRVVKSYIRVVEIRTIPNRNQNETNA